MTPIAIPPELYWKFRAAIEHAHRVRLESERAVTTANAKGEAVRREIAAEVSGFRLDQDYRLDDESCTVTPMAGEGA